MVEDENKVYGKQIGTTLYLKPDLKGTKRVMLGVRTGEIGPASKREKVEQKSREREKEKKNSSGCLEFSFHFEELFIFKAA